MGTVGAKQEYTLDGMPILLGNMHAHTRTRLHSIHAWRQFQVANPTTSMF